VDESENNTFMLSFVDLMSCGLGAVLLLFLGLAIASHVGTITGISRETAGAGKLRGEAQRNARAPDNIRELVKSAPVLVEISGLPADDVTIEDLGKSVLILRAGANKVAYVAPPRGRLLNVTVFLSKVPNEDFELQASVGIAGRLLGQVRQQCKHSELKLQIPLIRVRTEGPPNEWIKDICGKRR
jgi:hypothetical protein